MIKWYESKIVLFNIAMTILDILTLLQQSKLFDEHASAALVLAQGVGNIVLRVWFSSKPIEKSLT